MKTRTKTILLLITIFLLGMFSGAIVQKILIRKEFRSFSHRVQNPELFVKRFEAIIEPTPEQQKQIREVLEKHHEKMLEFHRKFPMRMDSLRQELDSILTAEQKKKLHDSRWFRHRPERPKLDRDRPKKTRPNTGEKPERPRPISSD
jgi:hypothetical protein